MNKQEAKQELIKLMGEEFINNHYTEREISAMAFAFSIGHDNGCLHTLRKWREGNILSYEKHNKA
jgi:hypothetical protein